MKPPPRPVKVYNGHPKLTAPRAEVVAAVRALDDAAADATDLARGTWRLAEGELSVAFLTDPALARLHGDFMADPTTTDVITFPAQGAHGLAGEVCISADTARRYARDHAGKFAEELALYLVHGYLHLCGYDDTTPPARRQMRAAERRAMAVLRTQRRLPGFALGR